MLETWQSEKIDLLTQAIVAAQKELKPAIKEAENPFFHKKYADLAGVWAAIKPFTEHDIAITQSPMDSLAGTVCLDTQLTHVSGQWMRSRLTMPLAKSDPQGMGSAITYARRYALGCMTGLVTESDDDGNAATLHALRPAPLTTEYKPPAPPARPVVQPKPTELEKQLQESLNQSVKNLAKESAPYIVKIGRQKNQPIGDHSDENLDWLLRYYLDKIQTTPTSRFRDEWEEAVLAIRGEQLNRYPDTSYETVNETQA